MLLHQIWHLHPQILAVLVTLRPEITDCCVLLKGRLLPLQGSLGSEDIISSAVFANATDDDDKGQIQTNRHVHLSLLAVSVVVNASSSIAVPVASNSCDPAR